MEWNLQMLLSSYKEWREAMTRNFSLFFHSLCPFLSSFVFPVLSLLVQQNLGKFWKDLELDFKTFW